MPLHPKQTFAALVAIISCLFAAHLGTLFLEFYLGHPRALGVVPLFDMAQERNIPTFYSALALFFCGTVLSIIALAQKRSGWEYGAWMGLSALFIFLSVDEAVSLHERVAAITRAVLHTSGVFRFAWVIPYGIALLGLAAVYVPFLFRLPRRTMILFLMAGGTFVGGAMGLELLGGHLADTRGMDSFVYALSATLEELMEMLGVAVFIFAALDYASQMFGGIALSVGVLGSGEFAQAPQPRKSATPVPAQRNRRRLFFDTTA